MVAVCCRISDIHASDFRPPSVYPGGPARGGPVRGTECPTRGPGEGDHVRTGRVSARIGGVVLAVGAVLIGAAPAYAAVPTNDAFGGAVTIGSVPFTTTLDTSEATTDADDTNANANCGAPTTDASVWYSMTSANDKAIVVD